jgi:uncharacterized phage-associated protein
VGNIKDVAAYILAKGGLMTAMKLQKLCYYAYGYHLVWEERRLFPERFEAWANGPVSPALYACHRGLFSLVSGQIRGNPEILDTGERESIELVLAAYGEFSAHELSVATHHEAPWQLARRRAGVAPLERSNEELDDGEIQEFFEALVAAAADDEEED